jgi:hypothetical protein
VAANSIPPGEKLDMAVGIIPPSLVTSLTRAATDNIPGLGSSSSPTSSATTTSTSSAAFRDIVKQYDIRNITPRQFSSLIEQLHDSGTISDADQKELAQLRAELDQSGADPDESMNLLDFMQTKIAQLQKKSDSLSSQNLNTGNLNLATAQKQLDWVKKLATVQSPTDNGGVDAVA